MIIVSRAVAGLQVVEFLGQLLPPPFRFMRSAITDIFNGFVVCVVI